MSKETVKGKGDGDHPRSRSAAPRLPGLNARIRARRAELGLTGATLAARAGISSSYVSLIETGAKVPDETVAAAIARGLEDDEALYRAWARAARLGLHDLPLLNRLELIGRTPAYRKLVESGGALPVIAPSAPPAPPPSPTDPGLASRLREVASQLGSPAVVVGPDPRGEARRAARTLPTATRDIVSVAVLAEGLDPDVAPNPAPGTAEAEDRLLLDARLFGAEETGGLFAYEVTHRMVGHLRGIAGPGDLLVFRRGYRPDPDLVAAVRTRAGVVLARTLYKDGSLLLLPGDGEPSFETMAVENAQALDGVIAGTHALVLRRAPGAPTLVDTPRTMAPSRPREPVR
jgi:transcriptional regulator with XRE-family HTH domain